MNTKDLFKLQKKIQEAKEQEQELNGQEKGILNQIKEKWNCESIEELYAIQRKKEDTITSLKKKKEKRIKTISKLLADGRIKIS